VHQKQASNAECLIQDVVVKCAEHANDDHLLDRMVGWTAVVMALQGWLSETPEQKRTGSTPGYFSVGMAFAHSTVTRR
ncbi:MAG: hypothetical protein M1835_002468, partial [Candelina submexicana]